MAVKMNEDVGRKLVKVALPRRVFVELLAQPRIAEIAEQQHAKVEIAGEDARAR